MSLTQLRLQNCRCYNDFEIDLREQFTGVILPDVFGKTPLWVVFWSFIKGFDLCRLAGKPATFEAAGVRLALSSEGNMEAQTSSVVEARGDWSDTEHNCSWMQQRRSMQKNINTIGGTGAKR